MEAGESQVKLRQRMTDLLRMGVVDEKGHGVLQSVLMQLYNDCERQRQACMNQADSFRAQAKMAEGQANGFAAVSSIVYNTINGFVVQAERAAIESAERAKEREEAARVAGQPQGEAAQPVVSVETTKGRKPRAKKE